MKKHVFIVFWVILYISLSTFSYATDYHVGPGQTYTTIGAVPWYSLVAGDNVYIHYRSTPYKEKILVSGRGTASQWIRVLGVLGPNGERPVIDGNGATTGTNMHFARTPEQFGAIIVAASTGQSQNPTYIEIANLEISGANPNNSFIGQDDTIVNYDSFCAGIYARAIKHLLIYNNVIHDCGLGFYNWAGCDPDVEYDGMPEDIVVRGNYFYNNGVVGSYSEHATYTESDGVTIEYNYYGPQLNGQYGSQIKDRSAGAVIRYNYIVQSNAGYDMDLVDPHNSWCCLGLLDTYKQTHVFGNIIVNNGVNYTPNGIHWNEDSYTGTNGRADMTGGKLLFYDNTWVTVANDTDMGYWKDFYYFIIQMGGYDCPSGTVPGIIDIRNNIFAVLPRTSGSPIPTACWGWCPNTNFAFGKNWVSPGWATTSHGQTNTGTITGTENLVSPADNNPGFVDLVNNDFHLLSNSSASGIGGALAPEVTNNYLGLDLTPTLQYVYHHQVTLRSASGVGSDVGAFQGTGMSVVIQTPSVPNEYGLNQNYPNPFNPTTTIEITLAQNSKVLLKVYNVLGQEVATLLDGEMQAGVLHRVPFDASRFSSGIYFYRLEAEGNVQVKKMVLMK